MKFRHASFVMFFVAVLLASCASLIGAYEKEIPLAQLQEAISKRFPFNNRYLELLDVRLTNPRITLQPGTNRILTSMDTAVAPPFMKRSWNGNFAVSGQLRFDPSRNALVLGDPRVEQFNVNGLDPLYANQLVKVGNVLVEELLKDTPLYTFRPDELRYYGARFNPTKITAHRDSLVVTFEPAR